MCRKLQVLKIQLGANLGIPCFSSQICVLCFCPDTLVQATSAERICFFGMAAPGGKTLESP